MNSVIVMMTFNIVYTAVVCWSLLVTILFPTDMLAMFDDLKGMMKSTILRECACQMSNAPKNLTVIKESVSKDSWFLIENASI